MLLISLPASLLASPLIASAASLARCLLQIPKTNVIILTIGDTMVMEFKYLYSKRIVAEVALGHMTLLVMCPDGDNKFTHGMPSQRNTGGA